MIHVVTGDIMMLLPGAPLFHWLLACYNIILTNKKRGILLLLETTASSSMSLMSIYLALAC